MKRESASASAPGRCGILGNPSDIYGGKVLSSSVPTRARCEIRRSDRDILPEDLRLWNAAVMNFPPPFPVEVTWNTDIPRSSGLSGSTALLAATVAALMKLRGDAVELETVEQRSTFAEMNRRIERFDADIVCGYQDSYMILHGHIQLMDFAGKSPSDAGPHASLEPVEVDLPFLLVTTGVERLSGKVHGPMAQRWLNGEEVVRDGIARISELAEPGTELLKAGDLEAFGALMDENQQIIAEMGGSGDEVDRLIAACTKHGALGAKLAGAGMGGTIIALTEEPDALEKALREEGYARFIRPESVPGLRLENG